MFDIYVHSWKYIKNSSLLLKKTHFIIKIALHRYISRIGCVKVHNGHHWQSKIVKNIQIIQTKHI